jgi:hypothetical protein
MFLSNALILRLYVVARQAEGSLQVAAQLGHQLGHENFDRLKEYYAGVRRQLVETATEELNLLLKGLRLQLLLDGSDLFSPCLLRDYSSKGCSLLIGSAFFSTSQVVFFRFLLERTLWYVDHGIEDESEFVTYRLSLNFMQAIICNRYYSRKKIRHLDHVELFNQLAHVRHFSLEELGFSRPMEVG